MLEGKVIRVRWVKSYPSAHNHVAIGDVLGETPRYVVLLCKTYHFRNNVGGAEGQLCPGKYVAGILEGEKSVRVIPWSRIEVINELSETTDWDVRANVHESGLCTLANKENTVVVRAQDTDVD